MATREKREYSSNVVRVLYPNSTTSPVKDIDNLDYLLDDLQSSVSRPGNSTLSPGNISNYSSETYRERSLSPRSNEKKIRTTASYQYSTSSPLSTELHQNTNQLDSLLLDLQQERESARIKDNSYTLSSDSRGILDPETHVGRSTYDYTTTSTDGGTTHVQREVIFNSPDSTISSRYAEPSHRSPTYKKTIETKTVRDVAFEPTVQENSKIITSKNTIKTTNVINQPRDQTIDPYARTVALETVELPDDLKNVPISDDILPVPGTKVTTTVRTYTYEIPADYSTTTKTVQYNNVPSPTQMVTNEAYNERTERNVPQTVVFKTESYRNDTTDEWPIPREPPLPNVQTTKSIIHKRDTRNTTTNYYPGDKPPNNVPPYVTQRSPDPNQQQLPPTNTTIIYKHDVHNTSNINGSPYPPGFIPENQPSHPHPQQPAGPGPTKTYYYKHESSNTTNTTYGPPPNGVGPPNQNQRSPVPTKPDHSDGYPPNYSGSPPHNYSGHPPNYSGSPTNNYPPNYAGQPPPSTTLTTYKYSTNTSTTGGPPGGHGPEREPLLHHPAPFPIDGADPPFPTDGTELPPKRLDDLLASFGNGNDRQNPEEPYIRKREIETAVAQPGTANIQAEPRVPSKNVAGPPVYYPPGHEMFTRKEEGSAAGYRAQGGYARGAGKYEYAAESKSKSKSSGGATMVPVCLPLCCAMPCSIM